MAKIKLLTQISTNKVSTVAQTIGEAIKNGEVNPAEVGVALKKFHKLYEEVNKDKEVKDIIFTETEKYKEGNKKTIELMGAKITIGSVRTWWEYNECQDPYWNELDSIEKQIKELKKARETQLQATVPINPGLGIPASTLIIDKLPKLEWEDSGDIVTIVPPIKKSTEGLKYSV